jgi:hypothetical protein
MSGVSKQCDRICRHAIDHLRNNEDDVENRGDGESSAEVRGSVDVAYPAVTMVMPVIMMMIVVMVVLTRVIMPRGVTLRHYKTFRDCSAGFISVGA